MRNDVSPFFHIISLNKNNIYWTDIDLYFPIKNNSRVKSRIHNKFISFGITKNKETIYDTL